jgi:hypothetical protein
MVENLDIGIHTDQKRTEKELEKIKKKEKVKAAKRPDTHLAMVVHKPPKEFLVVFGKRFHFSYSILHLMLLSFTFGWINSFTLMKFGVFSTLVTGKLWEYELKLSNVTISYYELSR